MFITNGRDVWDTVLLCLRTQTMAIPSDQVVGEVAHLARSGSLVDMLGAPRRAVCIGHAPCPDGQLAAAIALTVLREAIKDVEYIGCQPGGQIAFAPPGLCPGTVLVVLDVCFDYNVMADWVGQIGWDHVLFIDHHRSNWATMTRLRGMQEQRSHRRTIVYDPQYAACELLWRWLYPGRPVPDIVAAIGDQDTGRCVVPDSEPIKFAALETLFAPRNIDTLVRAVYTPDHALIPGLVTRGREIIAADFPEICDAVAKASVLKWSMGPGEPAATVAVVLQSDWRKRTRIAELCARQLACNCTAFVWDDADNRYITFMSPYERTGFDTLRLSVPHGGGGHPGASRIKLGKGADWRALFM